MKMLVRLCASTACTLIMGATGFAHHYTQTNLGSNTSGAVPVTDPQLINPGACHEARAAVVGL